MLNQVVLVGRLLHTPQLKTLDDGRVTSSIQLVIERNYKVDGSPVSDVIQVYLNSDIAKNTVQYCKANSVVGIKARVKRKYFEYAEGKVFPHNALIAEKITFINSGDKDVA